MSGGIQTTRPISESFSKWLFEDGFVIKLLKRQHLFLTRGSKHIWAFSFPTGVFRPLHKRVLQAGYSISIEDFKTCAFVLDVKGVRLPDGTWIKFEETD